MKYHIGDPLFVMSAFHPRLPQITPPIAAVWHSKVLTWDFGWCQRLSVETLNRETHNGEEDHVSCGDCTGGIIV